MLWEWLLVRGLGCWQRRLPTTGYIVGDSIAAAGGNTSGSDSLLQFCGNCRTQIIIKDIYACGLPSFNLQFVDVFKSMGNYATFSATWSLDFVGRCSRHCKLQVSEDKYCQKSVFQVHIYILKI